LHVGPATLGDLPQVRELFAALHAFNATFGAHFQLSPDWPALLEERFARTVDAPDHLWALAWDDDEAVGLIVGEHHSDPPIFGGHAWFELSALYVRPSHRRHGTARRLVEYFEDWARTHGYDTIQLYVSAANADARAFYRRQGYRPTQEIWRKELSPRHDTPPRPGHQE
jgi:GNAT superfamily N-acetyltransferase